MDYLIVLLLSLWYSLGSADSTFKPVRPPALPLAVRNPYLSTWLPAGSDGGNGGYLAGEWPTFWNGAITGWAGMIRVDGKNYIWMGDPQVGSSTVKQTSYEYTSTRSTFTMTVAGKVGMTIEFLSPVFADDMKRQGFPVSYMQVNVKSIDGKSHKVQLYTDISAEWVSGNRDDIAEWEYGTTTSDSHDVAYHHVYRQTPSQFNEYADQTLYGDWYYATENDDTLTYKSGTDNDVRKQFVSQGSLDNKQDTNYRAINDNYPVFAFAKDLTCVDGAGKSVLFTMNLAQSNVIRFESKSGNVTLPGFWTNYFTSNLDAVRFFYNDFSTSSGLATTLDNKIAKDSKAAAGTNYLALTSLATRQAFGSLQLAGTPEKPYLFMKEISSDGNTNTVDVIFPFHPITIYLNPNLLKLLLDPIFEIQESGYWPFKYAIHDIGAHYPKAIGHNGAAAADAEKQPVEECGNMILMTLAYAQQTGDNAYLNQHYALLKQWNTFLINKSLYPGDQISTDDFAGSLANQTNLAIKGIVGIKAMAQIASRAGKTKDAANFNDIADRYLKKWLVIGTNKKAKPPHTTLSYGMEQTHGLLYNVYTDKELGLNFVPQSLFNQQSRFYPTVARKYGVPLDTRHTYTKNDWEIYCAAVSSKATKDFFVNRVATWVNSTNTYLPFSDLHDTITGEWPSDGPRFINRPVVGGMFALLSLTKAP